MLKMKLENFILILKNIYNNCNIVSVVKGTGLTYSHISWVLKEFEKRGIIITEKVGRNRRIILTESGNILKNSAMTINKILKIC